MDFPGFSWIFRRFTVFSVFYGIFRYFTVFYGILRYLLECFFVVFTNKNIFHRFVLGISI